MHPAYSVIFFTTASGAGYGLLFWLSLAELFGALPQTRWLSAIALTVALGLVTLGLLSSTFHLGHPERAMGAFSQWRSSWLSREGVAAVATYVPAGLLWLIWVFGIDAGVTPLLGLLSALGAVVTVYCTSMIYASLRTIRQWHHRFVPLVYLALAAGTGALLFCLIFAAAGPLPVWPKLAALLSLGLAGGLKLRYWSAIDGDPGQYTTEMATGLGHLGRVRPLDPPHTMPNFVMREMGYAVARKHAERLRKSALLSLFLVPLLMAVMSLVAGTLAGALFAVAVVTAAFGVFLERWLFFAEAEHVSQLYYGRSRA